MGRCGGRGGGWMDDGLSMIAMDYHQTCDMIKTHVRVFLDTDIHEVSWHFATHEAVGLSGSKFNCPSENQCQRSHSNGFLFLYHT